MQISGTQGYSSYQTLRLQSNQQSQNPVMQALSQAGFSKDELSKISTVLEENRPDKTKQASSENTPEQMTTKLTEALSKQGFTEEQINTVLDTLEQNRPQGGPRGRKGGKDQLSAALTQSFSQEDADKILEAVKSLRSEGPRFPGSTSNGDEMKAKLTEALSEKGFTEEQINTVTSILDKQRPPMSMPQDMAGLQSLNSVSAVQGVIKDA